MPAFQDLTDQRFNKLVVLRRVANAGRFVMWECQCDCGNLTKVKAENLKDDNTKSCGCLNHVKVLVDIDWNDPVSRNVRRRELYAAKVANGYKRIRTPEYREQKNTRRKQRYNENLEQSRLTGRKTMQEWRHAHPEAVQLANNTRRARLQGAPKNDLTEGQWHEIKIAYGHRCVYCGRKMKRLTQDHVIPLSKGGSHTATNVVPACGSCNARKHTGPVLVPIQQLLFIPTPIPLRNKMNHG